MRYIWFLTFLAPAWGGVVCDNGVEANATTGLQILVVHDESSALGQEVELNYRRQFGAFFDHMQLWFEAPQFGNVFFSDKSALGGPEANCFKTQTNFTTDPEEWFSGIYRRSNADIWEPHRSVPDALLRAPLLHWPEQPEPKRDVEGRDEAYGNRVLRMILVTAKYPTRRAGAAGPGTPSNLPPSSGTGEEDCEAEDYPSAAQLRGQMRTGDFRVGFLISAVDEFGLTFYRDYERFLEEIGVPGSVQEVQSDAEDLYAKMTAAVREEICRDLAVASSTTAEEQSGSQPRPDPIPPPKGHVLAVFVISVAAMLAIGMCVLLACLHSITIDR